MDDLYLKATMKDGNLVIKNHDQVRQLLRQLDNKELVVHITLFEEKATVKQFRWYWGVAIQKIIQLHKDHTGEILSKNEVHLYNLNMIVQPKLRTKEILGKTIIEIEEFSMSKMSKRDFNNFKTKLQEFWAKRDIIIPDPGEEDFVNEKSEKAYESLKHIRSGDNPAGS